MNARIEDLAPDVQPLARDFLRRLEAARVEFAVTSTLRTTAEQAALYAQGRDPIEKVNGLRVFARLYPISERENTYTVTNCDGIEHKSNHQSGRALDVVPLDTRGRPYWPPVGDLRWAEIAVHGEAAGFSWGGRWVKPDCPHYEIA
jgi:peptidoglycan L-alanyl-D-glutamate endopeptidase CwlK